MSPLGVALAVVVTALRVPGPLSPRIANYQIDARLDVDGKTVVGHERITWRNSQSGAASELVFHLYMNAFKNQSSTFLRESRGDSRGYEMEEHGWGAIDVTAITVAGVDVMAQLHVDDTLAILPLARAIAPGETVAIDIDWKTSLPKVFARAGYHDDFFAIAQWYPKIGVFQCGGPDAPACRWRAHQYHANSEFFSDYGVYDVALDLPARFIVGATGVPVDETALGDEKRLRFHAEDVLDFAIAAYPRFTVHEARLADPWGEVELRLLEVPGRESHAERHLEAARVALAELERRLGPYPYRRLTIVDVPAGAAGAGGMEYPTLFFTDGRPTLSGFHVPEMVTVHELAHQYFQHLVGSDEVEEAWLDEGFTQTATEWSLRRQFGEAGEVVDLLGHRISITDADRLRYRQVARLAPIATASFAYPTNAGYGATTYARTQVALRTVENLVGAARFEAGMRRYYESERFRHPREADFVRDFDAGAGADLGWFWPAALHATGDLDYDVLTVDDRVVHPPAGWFDQGGARQEVPLADDDAPGPHHGEALIYRRGEVVFPVELRARFADGSERRETWDGGSDGARFRRFEWEGPAALTTVEIDPGRKVPLDVNRWNDGRRVKADPAPRRRVVGALQQALATLMSLVGF